MKNTLNSGRLTLRPAYRAPAPRPLSNSARGVSAHINHGGTKVAGRRKTVCTSHVLAALGIDASTYHYSGYVKQMLTVARKHWSLRSVKSRVGKGASVGAARTKLAGVSLDDSSIVAYVVHVDGHAMLIGTDGKTIVDTDPRKADRRKIIGVYAVRPKGF